MKKIDGGIVLNYPSLKEIKTFMIICKKCVMNDTVKEFKINKEVYVIFVRTGK